VSPRRKDKKKLDARAKPERVWTAARLPVRQPVAVGDDFDRPVAFVWLDAQGPLAMRVVPQDAPDDVIVALYAEARAHARGGAPTLVRATEPELAAALSGKLPQGPRVVVDQDTLTGRDLSALTESPPFDPRGLAHPLLEGAKVTGAELGAAVRALAGLHPRVPWESLAPWSLEFVLRAPAQGLPDASLAVQHDETLTLARSWAARDHTLTWERRARPRGTFFLDAMFLSEATAPVLAEEAAAQGWREAGSADPLVGLLTSDVEGFRRPVVRSDLDLIHLVADAIAAWFAEERRVNFWCPTPLTIGVAPGVTLEVRTTALSALRAGDADHWLDRWGPSPPEFSPFFQRHTELLATLRNAGDLAPPDIEARVLAAGPSAVPALCEALKEALEPDHEGSEWYAPWLLLALGRLGDMSALSHVVTVGVLHRPELGDSYTEDLPAVFAGFGPRAIPQLTELLASPCLDPYLRVAAGTALFAIGVDHPEARPTVCHVLHALYKWLDEVSDPEGTVSSLLATRAVRTGDAALYDAVVRAVEDGLTDPTFITLDELEGMRAEARWSRDGQADLVPVAAKLRRPDWTM